MGTGIGLKLRRATAMFLSASVMASGLPVNALADESGNETASREMLWSTSFEDQDEGIGLFKGTPDEEIGIENVIVSIPEKKLVGDFTDLVDRDTIEGTTAYNDRETKENLFDNNSGTKFLANVGVPVEVIWTLTEPIDEAVTIYAVTSANDAPERDPQAWEFQGFDEQEQDWVTLDQQTGQQFSGRHEQQVYAFENETVYQKYRFVVTANRGGGGMVQWADLHIATGIDRPAPIVPGMEVNIKKGPQKPWNQAADRGWTGSRSLDVSGAIEQQGEAYAAYTLFDNLDLPVAENTNLGYKIFPDLFDEYNYDFEYTQMYMSIDLKFTDGTYLSGLDVKDQNGNQLRPMDQGRSRVLLTNQWNYVYADISAAAGKTIDSVLVRYHKDQNENESHLNFRSYFDDIEIYNKDPEVYDNKSDYVNILRGTNGTAGFSRGLTAPAVTRPHGFNFFAPATNYNSNTIYEYQHQALKYITISHEPSIWVGDRGTWQFMANTSLENNAGSFDLNNLRAPYSHENEVAKAHYYSVEFDKDNGAAAKSRLEVTPSLHGAVVRFSYDDDAANRNVLLDCVKAGGGLSFSEDGQSFEAYSDDKSNGSKRIYIYGEFSEIPERVSRNGKQGIARFAQHQVEMKLATSYISSEQARKNLELELDGMDFDAVYAEAQQEWDRKLNVIDNIVGATEEELVTVYSNLYRLFAYPNLMSENTGTAEAPVWQYKSPYRGDGDAPVDGKIYINNGFWDTYRTTWAAYELFTPKSATELLDGLVQHYVDQSWVPRWIAPGGTNSMVGTSSDVIFADALMKDIDFDVENAYLSALRNAASVSSNLTNGGRKDLNTSIFRGYTAGGHENFSWSMEGYINDFGIAQMAHKLAERENDPAKKQAYQSEYRYYSNRAKNYVLLFDDAGEDVADKWFRGREANGNWTTGNFTDGAFDPFFWGSDYTETNAYNMAVSAVQDGQGMANLYGSREALAEKIDTIFETNGIYNGYGAVNGVGGIHEQREAREVKLGQYGHSNQPSHHIPYMYNYAGQPWKTQKYVRDVLERCYTGGLFGQGYIGDEDNGEMSGWYLFSMLGFYPVTIGSDEYAVGSPLFDEVTVNLENGQTLVVRAENNSKENVYVQSMALNGEQYNKSFIKHTDIAQGGLIEFVMGEQPNESFGSGEEELPSSLTKDEEIPQVYKDFTDMKDGLISINAKAGLIDNNSSTAAAFTETANEFEFSFTNGQLVELFTLTSPASGKAPERVQLYGKNGGAEWQELVEYDDLVFNWSSYTRPFEVPDQQQDVYSDYKLVLTGGDGLAEIELLGYWNDTITVRDLEAAIKSAEAITADDLIQFPEEIRDAYEQALADAVALAATENPDEEQLRTVLTALREVVSRINGSRSAFVKIEAEEFDAADSKIVNDGKNIGGVQRNTWVGYKNILFPADADYFEVYYSAQSSDAGGYIDIYLDDRTETEPVGRIEVPKTGSWQDYRLVSTDLNIEGIKGIHDVYLVFSNDTTDTYVSNVDWFRFDKRLNVAAAAAEGQEAYGTITPQSTVISYGGSQEFEIVPADGYKLDKVMVNDTELDPELLTQSDTGTCAFTLEKIAADQNIAVYFAPKAKSEVQIDDIPGVKIKWEGGSVSQVEEGTLVKGTVTIPDNKWIENVTLSGEGSTEEVNWERNADGTYQISFVMSAGAVKLHIKLTDKFIPVTGVRLNVTDRTLKVKETLQLSAVITPANATNKQLNWKSSNTTVADVNAAGKVTAKTAGNAVITATAKDGSGKSVSARIKVIADSTDPKPDDPDDGNKTPAAKKITVKVEGRAKNQKANVIYLQKGKKVQLQTAVSPVKASQKVTYSLSKQAKKIISVSKKGVIKGRKKGKAVIMVYAKDKKAKTKLTVYVESKAKKPTKLTVSKKKLSVKAKSTYNLGKLVKVTPTKTTYRVTYKSSKKSVATVDKYGTLKARKKGRATITIKCGSKVKKISLTVKK